VSLSARTRRLSLGELIALRIILADAKAALKEASEAKNLSAAKDAIRVASINTGIAVKIIQAAPTADQN